MQSDMFAQAPEHTPISLDMPDADVRYIPNFILGKAADQYLATFADSLAWRQDHIRMFGKSVKIPRLQAWYGDKEAMYTYSGLTMIPLPWTRELSALRQQCESTCQTRFNSVLANYYRHGQDSMGAHADNEAELGQQPVIASLSFGQQRSLIFRHQVTGQKQTLPLAHGSLLIMAGNTQKYWHHAINKSRSPLSMRINLTFRMIYPIEK